MHLGTIQVGANEVEIEVVGGLHDCQEGRLFGHYCEEIEDGDPKFAIRLAAWKADRRTAQVLLHETLHAIESAYGLELGEHNIRTLEQALTVLFRDHPELYAPLWTK